MSRTFATKPRQTGGRTLRLFCALSALFALIFAWAKPWRQTPGYLRVGIVESAPLLMSSGSGATGLVAAELEEAARRKGIKLEWKPLRTTPELALRQHLVDLIPIASASDFAGKQAHVLRPWLRSTDKTITVQGRHAAAEQQGSTLADLCSGKTGLLRIDSRLVESVLLASSPECSNVRLQLNSSLERTKELSIVSNPKSAIGADILARELAQMARDGSFTRIAARWSPAPASEADLVLAQDEEDFHRRYAYSALAMLVMGLVLVMLQARRLKKAQHIAETANAAKSQFLANMSHEIRTPMNGVIGMTEVALAQEMSEELRRSLEVVRQSTRSLLNVVNDILDFSKIEAGKLHLDHVKFDVRSELESALAPLREQATRKKLKFEIQLPDTVPSELFGDPARLRQVVTNLVSNAIKFTPQGEVTVSCRVLRETGTATQLRIGVRDTGIGISPEEEATLFRPFTQVDNSMTRQFGGSGLGLAICRELVHLLGGDISVESRPGAGSIFWFTAWFERSDAAKAPAKDPSAALPVPVRPMARTTVLLAEDNPINQVVARKLLEKLGCIVEVASNGKNAVELWREKPFRAIFMDCQMPEMDGYQATRIIRNSEEPGCRIPIIALTAHAMAGDRERCLQAGMDDYLAKPVQLAELNRVVGRWCFDSDLAALSNAIGPMPEPYQARKSA